MAAEDQSVNPPTPETAALPTEAQQHVVAPTLRPSRGKNFLLFPKLAYELQDMIFKFAAEDLDPNIVKIYLKDPSAFFPEVCLSYKVPSLLEVNRRAREVTKKIYPLAFSDNLCGKPVYFNVRKDVLYFDKDQAHRQSQTPLYMFNLPVAMVDSYSPRSDVVLVQKQVRFIILHQGDTGSDLEATLALAGGFHNLKALIIVKESGTNSRLVENDARVCWNNVMYRFSRCCALDDRRVPWESRMHNLLFICMERLR
jgi:hypothetical protein